MFRARVQFLARNTLKLSVGSGIEGMVRVHSLNNVPYLAWNLESGCVSGAYLR